jgi:uncharacterized membrane protein
MRKKFFAFAVLLCLILFCFTVSVFAQTSERNRKMPVVIDRDLVIQISDIGENAIFYPLVIDGIEMEVLVVRAGDNTIRTAFNTCQVCFNTGLGFFVQEGSFLVCQACHRRFRMTQVERQGGGCNPEPIFPENKTVSSTTITIPLEHLRRHKEMFANWKE